MLTDTLVHLGQATLIWCQLGDLAGLDMCADLAECLLHPTGWEEHPEGRAWTLMCAERELARARASLVLNGKVGA